MQASTASTSAIMEVIEMAMTAYSKAIREKAEELVAKADTWAYGTRNSDGLRFILFASRSRPDIFYMTRIDGEGCTCPAARLSKRANCCHQVAAAMVTEAVREAVGPKARYEELIDAHQREGRRELVDAF